MTFCHFINIIEEAVRLAPESPFTAVCDLIDRLLHMHTGPSMHCTQGRLLRSLAAMSHQELAEQRRKAQIQHVPYTQAVLTLARPSHQ